MGYTEEELSLLSQEERDAIAADSPEADRELLQAVAGDGDGDGEPEGDGAGDEGAESAEGAAADASDEEEGAAGEDGAEDGDAEEEGSEHFVPKYHAAPVEDYEQKMADLDQKFEDGDLQLKEYNQQRDALVRSQLKAEISSEQQEQIESQLWMREVSDFMDDHPEYKSSKMRNVALDATVKEIAADPANADKTYKWFLREAHKKVVEEFGGTAKPPANDNKPPVNSRKPDLSGVPKSLAHLPAAELPDTGSVDEFAHLDRMTGLELEKAVARLSESERERYRAAA